MYIQITTNCQMACAHCMMNTSRHKKGHYMSREVFARAIDLSEQYSEMIVLGGGEPTLHKEFFDFLDYSLIRQINGSLENILVITNGGFTKKTMKLLDKHDEVGMERLQVMLSQDAFHDQIDERIVSEFEMRGRNYLSTVEEENIILQGAAVENNLQSNNQIKGCHCEEVFVTPEGDLKVCACDDAEILGNIMTMTDEEYRAIKEAIWTIRDEEMEEPCHSLMNEEQRKTIRDAAKPLEIFRIAA